MSEKIKEIITDLVLNSPGCTGVFLATKSLEKLHKAQISPENVENPGTSIIPDILEKMQRDQKIVEIGYTHPHRPHQVKSLYFPKGTDVYLNKNYGQTQAGKFHIDYNWTCPSFPNGIPPQLWEALQESAQTRAMEMAAQGFTSGELIDHVNITIEGRHTPEDGFECKGWFTITT